MNSNHLPYWLAALYLPDIGPKKLLCWLDHFTDIHAFFSAQTEEWQALGMTAKDIAAVKKPNWQAIEKELSWAKQDNCHVIAFDDASYPYRLKEISSPPLVLFVRGNKTLLNETQLAMVGSRQATATGLKNANEFAYQLAELGFVITSGLALGIDGESHKGALAAKGHTIGVAGTGLNYIYPSAHHALFKEIIEKDGAILSEFPLETKAHPKNFPRRNRIIGGLSIGTLVVEAALKSGSLITARLALEQGREVFAIPGSIHNPLAKGCHYLIKEGAKLVETAADILEELSVNLTIEAKATVSACSPKKSDLSAACCQLLEQIGCDITPNDVILLRSGLTTGEVSSILLTLELNGYILSVPGGYVRVVAD